MTMLNSSKFGLLAAATILLTLTACADRVEPPVPQASVPPETVATADDGSVMTADYHYLANGNSVEKLIDLGEYDSVPWAVVASHPGSPSLFIGYVAGGLSAQACGTHVGVEVRETEDAVVIAALSTTSTKPDLCAASPKIEGGLVQLAAPLGERTLYHAPLGVTWASLPSPLSTEVVVPEPEIEHGAPVAYTGDATCESLVGPAKVATFKESGAVNQEKVWRAKIAESPEEISYSFLEFGGLVCGWGEPEGDIGIQYGFGPISEAQKIIQRERFESMGFKPVENKLGEAFANKDLSAGLWVIGADHWAYSTDFNGDGDLVETIVANAPKF